MIKIESATFRVKFELDDGNIPMDDIKNIVEKYKKEIKDTYGINNEIKIYNKCYATFTLFTEMSEDEIYRFKDDIMSLVLGEDHEYTVELDGEVQHIGYQYIDEN